MHPVNAAEHLEPQACVTDRCARIHTCTSQTCCGVVQETQTKPEGQIHFFPALFNGKQLYDVMVERCGPSQNSLPKESAAGVVEDDDE